MKLLRRLRYLLYAAAGLLLLAIVAAAGLLAFFDPNPLKPQIELAAQKALQRNLRLHGDIRLALYPSLGISLGKASLSEHSNDRVFASLESAHISVAVLPLLRGAFVVDEIGIDGLRASVVRRKDGTTNIDDLLRRRPDKGNNEAQSVAADSAAKEPRRAVFDISRMRIEHASLAYRDEASTQELAVSDLSLRTGRIASDLPGRLRISAVLNGRNPNVNAKLEIAGEYRFNLAGGSFELTGIEAKASGDFVGARGVVLVAKGDLARTKNGGELSASRTSIEARGMLGPEAFQGRMSVPKFSYGADTPSGESISAEFAFRGTNRALEARLRVGEVSGSPMQLAVTGIALAFDARAGGASLKGQLETSLGANLSAKVIDLRKFEGAVAFANPTLLHKALTLPLSGNLRADLAGEQVAAEIFAKLDDGRLRAKLDITQFSAPRYTFEADLDRLDIDRYLPVATATAAKTVRATPGTGADAGESLVNFDALKGVEANGRLGIGTLTARNVSVSNFTARFRVAGGRLEAQPVGASLYGGSLSGALVLDANDKRIATRQEFSDVQIGPLVRDLTGRDVLEGRGRIALDVEGAGEGFTAIRKSLSGSARLALRGGAVKGIDLANILHTTKLHSDAKAASQTADGQRRTEFSEFGASFTIRNGVAHNEDLAIKSSALRVTGTGDIDFGASRLDYTMRASVSKPPAGRVAGPTLPVRVSGPFDMVKFDVDYTALAASAVKAKVTEKISTLRQRAATARERLR